MRKLILFFPAILFAQMSFAEISPNLNVSPVTKSNSNKLSKESTNSIVSQTSSPLKPQLKKGEYLIFKSQTSGASVGTVKPSPLIAPPPPANVVTYFELTQENKQLVLRFRSRDPHLHLSQTHPIVVQLITNTPLQTQPSIILSTEWPKNSNQMEIKATGASQSFDNRIRIRASYTYCNDSTHVCKKAYSAAFYYYRF